MLKEDVAIAFENLVEDNAGVRPAYQLCQFALALLERHSPQVFAVEFDQIESEQHRILAVALTADQIEHRQTTLVGDNGFAVEQESMSGQSRYRVHGKGKPGREIIPVASNEPHTRTISPRHDAEAIMLDFVNPTGAGRRRLRG